MTKKKRAEESEIEIEDVRSEAEPEDEAAEAAAEEEAARAGKTQDVAAEEAAEAGKTQAAAEAGKTQAADDKAASKAGKAKADDKEAAPEDGKNNKASDNDKKDKASEEDETWSEKYTRLMADFQNFRKRTDKEKADVYSYANEKIMTDLLAVLDNFERALDSECKDEAYAEGMKMIFKQLTDILTASGLEEIEAVGQDFDPNFHHAVLTDNNEDFDSGKVTEVLQKGYKLNGKVIRPSMVKVNE